MMPDHLENLVHVMDQQVNRMEESNRLLAIIARQLEHIAIAQQIQADVAACGVRSIQYTPQRFVELTSKLELLNQERTKP